jgi:hypothetical protein
MFCHCLLRFHFHLNRCFQRKICVNDGRKTGLRAVSTGVFCVRFSARDAQKRISIRLSVRNCAIAYFIFWLICTTIQDAETDAAVIMIVAK